MLKCLVSNKYFCKLKNFYVRTDPYRTGTYRYGVFCKVVSKAGQKTLDPQYWSLPVEKNPGETCRGK